MPHTGAGGGCLIGSCDHETPPGNQRPRRCVQIQSPCGRSSLTCEAARPRASTHYTHTFHTHSSRYAQRTVSKLDREAPWRALISEAAGWRPYFPAVAAELYGASHRNDASAALRGLHSSNSPLGSGAVRQAGVSIPSRPRRPHAASPAGSPHFLARGAPRDAPLHKQTGAVGGINLREYVKSLPPQTS